MLANPFGLVDPLDADLNCREAYEGFIALGDHEVHARETALISCEISQGDVIVIPDEN